MFVIGYDYDEIICVVDTEADAQEMILAFAEEDFGEAMLYESYQWPSIEDFLASFSNDNTNLTIKWCGDLYWYQNIPKV